MKRLSRWTMVLIALTVDLWIAASILNTISTNLDPAKAVAAWNAFAVLF